MNKSYYYYIIIKRKANFFQYKNLRKWQQKNEIFNQRFISRQNEQRQSKRCRGLLQFLCQRKKNLKSFHLTFEQVIEIRIKIFLGFLVLFFVLKHQRFH